MIERVRLFFQFNCALGLFNKSDQVLKVTVYYGNGRQSQNSIIYEMYDDHSFNVGLNAFVGILWEVVDVATKKSTGECYSELMPSSKLMLMGILTIRNKGLYHVDFNASGITGKIETKQAKSDSCPIVSNLPV